MVVTIKYASRTELVHFWQIQVNDMKRLIEKCLDNH